MAGAALGGFALLTMTLALPACDRTGPTMDEWPVIGGDFRAQHHSPLTQIDQDNVEQLGLAWAALMPSPSGLVGNPLVRDDIVYQSGSLSRIFATDIRTGELLWSYEPEFELGKLSPNQLWGVRLNRGLALTDTLAVVGTGDCRVIAVDRMSGEKVWEVSSCDRGATSVEGITGAPRAGDGKIFVGNHCSDSGATRGFVEALDEKTGKRLWRFYTVPGDPSKPQDSPAMEMAVKTWGEDWYDKTHGCGSVWDAMTYDEKTGLLYVGTGGPAPWPPSMRGKNAGDELFTNAIVAIDADTGKYVWHYTVTPHDGWNLEASGPIMIAELPVGGENRRVLMTAPKNGFFYVLDAETGEFISADNPIPANWARGIDQKTGRPIYDPAARYWEKPGKHGVVWPGPLGAHGWDPMAFNPDDNLVYVSYDNVPTQLTVDPRYVGPSAVDEIFNIEGEDEPVPERYSELVAWDPLKQKARWRVRRDSLVNGGVLHTAGGLVFEGTSDGQFNAYDEKTGKRLWSYFVKGGIRSAPTAVTVDGEQYILVASGNGNSMVSSRYVSREATTPLTRNAPSLLLAFKIGGSAKLPKFEPSTIARPDFEKPAKARADAGKPLYEAYACLVCHGRDVISAGGEIPDLRTMPNAVHDIFEEIVIGGAMHEAGMPKFDMMPEEQLRLIQDYIRFRTWEDYEEQEEKRGKSAS